MRYAICLLFALSCVAYTQDLTTKLNAAPSMLEQVLYVADGTNLYTYDIDPQTFQPSLMGTIPTDWLQSCRNKPWTASCSSLPCCNVSSRCWNASRHDCPG